MDRPLRQPQDERFGKPALVTVGIATLIYFLDGLIHSILGPLAPDIARSLALGNGELGPIFSANLAGQCIGLVVFPVLAGRFGHRLPVILAVLGFGAMQSASALAWDATSLFALRLATGIFLGGCLPSCLAMVTAVAPTGKRGLAITTLFTGYGAGATAAGVTAAAFGDWRAATVAVGVVSIVAGVVAWLWLREPPARVDEADGANEGGGVLAVLRLLAPRYLFGTLILWLLWIAMLTISYCLNSWLPIMLVESGRDESYATLSVSIFSFGGIVAALGVGLLIDRLGATRVLVAFTLLAAIVLFAIGQTMATAPLTVLTPLLAAGGFFSLGAYGGVNVVLAGYYPDALRATGIGWAKSVGRIGTVIAPILIGFGLEAGFAATAVMSLFAVPALIAAFALVAIGYSVRAEMRRGPVPV
jgi:MFS family permease